MSSSETQLPTREIENAVQSIVRREGFKDFTMKVTAAMGKGENFLGDLFRVEITEKRAAKKMKLIVKVAPEKDSPVRNMLPIDVFYQREKAAYDTILPKICSMQDELKLPYHETYHFATPYPAMEELLILEDLGFKDYGMCDKSKSLDLNHVKMIVKKFAYLHALSFVMKVRDSAGFLKLAEHTCKGVGYGENFGGMITQNTDISMLCIDDPEVKGRLKKFFETIPDYLEKVLARKFVEPYNVICHGDGWVNNILFQHQDGKPVDLVFVDYQILRCCCPVVDIYYMIYSSTDKEFRDANLSYIWELYYTCLSERISLFGLDPHELYPWKVFKRHQEEYQAFGLIMGMILVPIILADKSDVLTIDEYMVSDGADKVVVSPAAKKRIGDIIMDFYDKNIF